MPMMQQQPHNNISSLLYRSLPSSSSDYIISFVCGWALLLLLVSECNATIVVSNLLLKKTRTIIIVLYVARFACAHMRVCCVLIHVHAVRFSICGCNYFI